jgi:hypothetical protein
MIAYTHLLWGGALFGMGLVVHVIWWRVQRPKDDIAALGICLVLIPAVLLLSCGGRVWYVGNIANLIVDLILILGLVVSLAAVYIISYPAAQAASPSMLIALRLASRGPEGMSVEELRRSLETAELCDETVPRLLDERFAHMQDGRLYLAERGRRLVRICGAWRRLLGLPKGEG